MTALTWDGIGTKIYETGVSKGVLYVPNEEGNDPYGKGVAWNGLTAVTESPSGAEETPLWADNIKYGSLTSNEEFGATVEAYTYPDEFEECDGSRELVKGAQIGQQARKVFGLSYRTEIGNDVDGNEHGYKLHLIYGCKASPSEKAYSTVSDSPDAITFSWELTTTPVNSNGFKPTSCVTIDSTKVVKAKLVELEKILYGDEKEARLPLPDEIKTLLTPTM